MPTPSQRLSKLRGEPIEVNLKAGESLEQAEDRVMREHPQDFGNGAETTSPVSGGGSSNDLRNNGIFNFLRKWAQSTTAGLSEPVAAGLSAGGEKALDLVGVWPEGESRSLGAAYDDYRNQGKETLGAFSEDNPGASFGADIAGLLTPGGVFNKAYKGASKVAGKAAPFISRFVGAGRAGKIAAGASQAAIRGGLSNAGYQALNPDVALEDKPADIGKAAALGAVLDVGATGVSEGFSAAKNAGKAGKKYLGELWRKTKLGQAHEAVKGQAFADDFGKVVQKAGADTPIGAGEAFTEGVEAADDAAFKQYKAIKDPILKKYKDSPASVEKLRQRIASELDDAGALTGKGSIDHESVIFSGPEGAYYKRLAKDLESLGSNPSMAELDRLLRGYGKLANFSKKADRTPAENMFGKIWGSGRDDLLDSAERHLVEAEKAGPQVKAAQKAVTTESKTQSWLAGKRKQPLQGEKMQQILAEDQAASAARLGEAQGAVKGEMAAATERGEMTAQGLRDARKSFAEKQLALERLRPMSRKDPEKIVAGAKSQLTGSFIQESVRTNPDLREPLKKAVLGDLAKRAQSQDQLKKAITDYGEEPLRELFQGEFDQLLKMAGISKKAGGPSFVSKFLKNKTVKALPRTAAPLISNETRE